ncbi:MAG TPA: hypothetical protein VF065_16180, partial [Ilumatobacter sp.]
MRRAAHRGISLSLVIGFLAPLCTVITPETPALPNAAAPVGDNILISGPVPATPTGSTITDVDTTFTDTLKAAAEAVWVGATFPTYEIEVANLDGDIGATTVGRTITFDVDAAGRMWRTDLAAPAAPPDLDAGVDLVTVLAHELGHVLGFADLRVEDFADEVMTESIGPGVRRTTVAAHTWLPTINGAATVSLTSGAFSIA